MVQDLCQSHDNKYTTTVLYVPRQNGFKEKGHTVAVKALKRVVIITGIVSIPVVTIARIVFRHKELGNQEYLYIFDKTAINEEITGGQSYTNPEQPLQLEVEIIPPDLDLDMSSLPSVAPTPDQAVQNCDAQNKSETAPQKDAR